MTRRDPVVPFLLAGGNPTRKYEPRTPILGHERRPPWQTIEVYRRPPVVEDEPEPEVTLDALLRVD